ncbi:hypothetical protein N0V88_000554 [Collariella sp. IMI 366227]|nr:hypothetical protein N0V88_000554 [Collariella sp. IMI 366227]
MDEQPFLMSSTFAHSTSDQSSPLPLEICFEKSRQQNTLPETAPPSKAEAELNRLIKEHPFTIGRYVTWQWNWNREYRDYDDPAVIVQELARTPGPSPSSTHAIFASFKRALSCIYEWKLKRKSWDDVMLGWGARMPRLPTSQQVKALRYLHPCSRGFPETIVNHARLADLEWLLWDGPQPTFWRGVPIDDEEWRSTKMNPGRPQCHLPVEESKLKALPGLIKAVFPKKPEGVVDYPKRAPRSFVRSASDNLSASLTADHFSEKGSSEWGDNLVTESGSGASVSATDDLKYFDDESAEREIDKLFSLPTTRPEVRVKSNPMELPKDAAERLKQAPPNTDPVRFLEDLHQRYQKRERREESTGHGDEPTEQRHDQQTQDILSQLAGDNRRHMDQLLQQFEDIDECESDMSLPQQADSNRPPQEMDHPFPQPKNSKQTSPVAHFSVNMSPAQQSPRQPDNMDLSSLQQADNIHRLQGIALSFQQPQDIWENKPLVHFPAFMLSQNLEPLGNPGNMDQDPGQLGNMDTADGLELLR